MISFCGNNLNRSSMLTSRIQLRNQKMKPKFWSLNISSNSYHHFANIIFHVYHQNVYLKIHLRLKCNMWCFRFLIISAVSSGTSAISLLHASCALVEVKFDKFFNVQLITIFFSPITVNPSFYLRVLERFWKHSDSCEVSRAVDDQNWVNH